MARRRTTCTSRSVEWGDEDIVLRNAEKIEMEDRSTSQFPYDKVQRIPDYYKGKDIFVTGATGFVGKVLIEKLLRSLPEGGRIFLLMRSKRGQSIQDRLRKMLQVALFKELMATHPESAERLVAVEGDCSVLGLGLSPSDRQLLVDNVSIIFHCAAVVRFNATNTEIFTTNLRGAREIVSLCKEMKRLEVLVHVSTSFCNATFTRVNQTIPEEVLPQGIDWRTVIAMAEKSEEDTKALDLLFNKIAPTHFVNYTFSKGLAECLVQEECQDIPVIIVRPSVVIATYEDPFAGWVDNLYGPMTVWDTVGRGILRALYAAENVAVDYVPVDFCVKSLIAAAWHRGLGFRISSDPKKTDVINSCTGGVSKNTNGILREKMQILFSRNGHRYIFRYPRLCITERYWLYKLIMFTSHIPLGVMVDGILRLKGQKPMLLSVYRKIHSANCLILWRFQSNQFLFDAKKNWTIQARIREEDRDIFYSPTKSFILDYYHDNIRGIIEHAFKEKPYPSSETNRPIMHVVDWIGNIFLAALGVWILYSLLMWKLA